MASSTSSSWKSSYSLGQETLETKTFTWRLRPHLALSTPQQQADTTAPSRNTKSVSRLGTPTTAGPTSSASFLNSSVSSQLQNAEQYSQFLRFQEFEVEAGQTLGLHSMWSIFLVSCGSTITSQKSNTNVASTATASLGSGMSPSSNSDFVGVFLRKMLKPVKTNQSSYAPSTKNDEILVRYKIEIMDRDGEILYTKDCEATPRDALEVGYWDWKKIVPVAKFQCSKGKSQTREQSIGGELSSEESLLLLRVSFTIVSRRKAAGKGKAHLVQSSVEEETSTREAANAFLSLVAGSNPKTLQPDVVIEINRRKFFVHKKVLIGRSPAFLKMLGAEKNDRFGGLIKADDISANTMELILKHIYTGQLEEEWTNNPVTATELIYSSEKYGLPALKEFCNKHLVRAANKNNCYRLMEVAQLHNLEKAAEDLMTYVSEGISSNSNSRKPSEESVQLHKSLV